MAIRLGVGAGLGSRHSFACLHLMITKIPKTHDDGVYWGLWRKGACDYLINERVENALESFRSGRQSEP